ncbi:TPA: hypothetical protein ACQC5M_004491, partial [Escherichia albertii]
MNVQPNTQPVNNPSSNVSRLPQAEHAPIQIPESELPPGCQAGFVVNIPEDIQQQAPECGERTALLSLVRDEGLLAGLDKFLAPHFEEGSAGKKALDQFGLFNVTQMALEIPSSVLGISGKYGVQMNIVKPDIHPSTGNYVVQLFPLHDEIGLNYRDLPGPLQKALSSDSVPWFGLTAQVVRNHGIELPIVKTENGWKLVGETPLTPDGPKANYTEEWVIRPGEADFKYGASPLQATLGLEFGAHFKWNLDNPNVKYAVLTNALANAAGAAGGVAVSRIPGVDPMLAPHIGSMAGQALGHAVQYYT